MNAFRGIGLITLIALLLSSCTQAAPIAVHSESNLIIEISKPESDGVTYIKYKSVQDSMIAKEVQNILKQADNSNSYASMSRNPDYKISIINTSPTASYEPRIYGIWVSIDPVFVEVVSESVNWGYINLNPSDSQKIIDLLK